MVQRKEVTRSDRAGAMTEIKAVNTAAFRLNKLSKRMQAILNHALLHNHLAYIKGAAQSQSLSA